ncbi:zinc ribbon domain-containing protein [Advenella sp. EE-W14]|uniref:zinc ribbon domain-containing protein n=1 Tax=Advenella sp. EE-W14 TaxID=2722705 RepID=UPI00145EEE55|nr:zinc ribbon domain-containing protein [Advenella sp. EE-W14]
MAKFCMKCGTALHEGAKFCMKCGHALPGIEQAAPLKIQCDRCGASLKTGMKFCPKCGAGVGRALTVDIPVSEPVISVQVSDLPPNVEAAQKEHITEEGVEKTKQRTTEKAKAKEKAKETAATAVKKEAVHPVKKALSALLDQTVSASDNAGEMRIAMTEGQKSLLTHVIRELAKRIVK